MPVKKFFLLLALLFAGPVAGAAPTQSPLVVASIRPLALMAQDLAGDWLAVETLLTANQEPHHVALSIAQRRQLERADLVLWVSPHLETFLSPLVAERQNSSQSFAQSLPTAAVERHPHDFHYWLAPALAADFYRELAARLTALFPARAAQVERALERQLKVLAALRGELAASLPDEGRLIVDHQAYGYFADAFDLDIAGALVDESGVAVGPRTLAALGRTTGVRCIAVATLPPTRRAKKMAATLGVPVVAIDPLGWQVPAAEGYAGVLRSVAKGFARCLVVPNGD